MKLSKKRITEIIRQELNEFTTTVGGAATKTPFKITVALAATRAAVEVPMLEDVFPLPVLISATSVQDEPFHCSTTFLSDG